MIKHSLILFVCLCLSPSVSAAQDKWTTGDTVLQSAVLVSLLIDRNQTRQINDAGLEELGWARSFIGPRPTSGRIDKYFLGGALLHTAIAHKLPQPYRAAWQVFQLSVSLVTINGNRNAGLKIVVGF